MSRYLVTGAAGFIGFHLARSLAHDGNEVLVVDDFSRGVRDEAYERLVQRPNVREIVGDLVEDETFHRLDDSFDVVYHMAAVNGTRTFYEEPYRVIRTNILSTLKVVDWIREGASVGRLVTASSSEAYAGTIRLGVGEIPTPEDIALTIADPFEARYSYGGSKIADELMVINGFREPENQWTIVRFHNVFGPRMGHEHVIPEFLVRALRHQDPFEIFGGDQTRTYYFIDDAVEALRRLAETPAASQRIVNVGAAGPEITAKMLAQAVHDIVGYSPQIKERGAPEGSVARRCPDIGLLKKLVGGGVGTSLTEGLRRTAEWYRMHLEDAPAAEGFAGLLPGR